MLFFFLWLCLSFIFRDTSYWEQCFFPYRNVTLTVATSASQTKKANVGISLWYSYSKFMFRFLLQNKSGNTLWSIFPPACDFLLKNSSLQKCTWKLGNIRYFFFTGKDFFCSLWWSCSLVIVSTHTGVSSVNGARVMNIAWVTTDVVLCTGKRNVAKASEF